METLDVNKQLEIKKRARYAIFRIHNPGRFILSRASFYQVIVSHGIHGIHWITILSIVMAFSQSIGSWHDDELVSPTYSSSKLRVLLWNTSDGCTINVLR